MRHPIMHLDFGGGDFSDLSHLRAKVEALLLEIEEQEGVPTPNASAAARFRHLIKTLHLRSGQRVVALVDEYEKPILDTLATPEVARANRDYMRGFYGVIKGMSEHLRFVFLTGVSKFSKVSLFSGFNNLIDITLDPRYSAI